MQYSGMSSRAAFSICCQLREPDGANEAMGGTGVTALYQSGGSPHRAPRPPIGRAHTHKF